MLFCSVSMNRIKAISWLRIIALIGVYGGLLLPLVFVPKVIFPFVFSKLLFFQILIGLTFPAYLILAWTEPKYRPRWTPMYLAVIAYFVALAVSVAFAVDPLRAWWGNQERMNGLFTLLHFLAWFMMSASILKTWKEWRKILIYEVALSVIMGCVSLLQLPFPNLLLFPASSRVGGLLDNPIYMAAYQIFNLFFIVWLWLKGASRSMKIFLVGAAVIDIGAFIAAQSRGALLGLAVGVVVFAITYAVFTPNKKAKRIVLSLAAFGFIVYGLIFSLRNTTFIQNTPLNRLTNFQVGTAGRFIAWDIAWQGFLERPITGWGLDDFHILFNAKYNPKSLEAGYYETWFDRSHNTVMDALSMTGIIGTVTFFGLFFALFFSVYRAYRKKWIDLPTMSIFISLPVAYFVQNLFVFDQPAGFTMSFFLYALVSSATLGDFIGMRDESSQPETVAKATKNIPWIAFGVLQACMLLVIWKYSVLPAKASMISIQSNSYFGAGMYPQALDLAKQAAAIPTPYLDEQTFLQSRNLISLVESGKMEKFADWRVWHDLILDISKKNLSEHPNNTHPHFIFARFADAFSKVVPEDKQITIDQYQEAIRTSPKRQQLYFAFARFYLVGQDKDRALELYKQAESFDPDIGEAHWYLGLTLTYDFSKKEEGAKELVAAVKAKVPYSPQNTQDAVALAIAYDTLKDVDGFKALLLTVPALSGGSESLFLELARVAEHLNLTEERNLILGAILRNDPAFAPNLLPLKNGTAKTIEESFKQALATQAKSTSTAPVQTITATTTAAGQGPRR